MTKRILLSLCLCLCVTKLYAQDAILQGFYWNTHPGDLTNTTSGGIWWDSLATIAPKLKHAGFKTVWIPSPVKSGAGAQDMGYGPYDYWDLGKFNQKGSIRTRFGTEAQLKNMVATMHSNNLSVMGDIILNHRAGADLVPGSPVTPVDVNDTGYMYRQYYECTPSGTTGYGLSGYTYMNPASGHFPGEAWHYHPNNYTCNNNGDYYTKSFFEDLSPLNRSDNTLNSTLYPGWYFGPHNVGPVGDSLIVWGRWLVNTIGIDELRLDAVKHVEHNFMAPFLIELKNGTQPFAVGEHWSGTSDILWYQNAVESFSTGSKNAQLSMFDFPLRYALRDMANGSSYNMWGLNTSGLVRNGLSGLRTVTFVENHDVDRGGYRRPYYQPDAVNEPNNWQPVPPALCTGANRHVYNGTTCLEYYYDSGHDPVVSNKHMAYAYIMAAEGRPTVYWKDYFWYKLDEDINWQLALRASLAGGTSTPIQSLNSFFAAGHGGDMFVLRRNGVSTTDKSLLTLNDNATTTTEVWVDTPFTNTFLKDYSDGFLFETTQAYADTRALLKSFPKDYAWYAPTGYYPKPVGEPNSSFSLKAGTAGAKLHYVVFRASDAANLLVNGSPIQAGDEIAILPAIGTDAVGLGRVGQSFRWDGVHDMVIEVLGGANTTEAKGGLVTGDAFRVAVKRQSTGEKFTVSSITFAPASTSFNFKPKRPSTRGNGSYTGTTPLPLTTSATNTYDADKISLVTAFNANNLLPIRLQKFGVQVKKNAVTLTWITASERENAIFEVEHAPPHEASFRAVATLQGAGTSLEARDYQYEAQNLAVGTHQFRLKQVDTDGNSSYSEVIKVTIEVPGSHVLYPAYPNPFNPQTTIQFAVSRPQPVTLQLYDMAGRLVKTLYQGTPIANESVQVSIDGQALANGTYLVRLIGQSFKDQQKITLIK